LIQLHIAISFGRNYPRLAIKGKHGINDSMI